MYDSKPPFISVIMPVFNGALFLPAALKGLAEQSTRDFELIVLEGGSKDNSREILADWQDKVPLRVIDTPAEWNWVRKTNVGMQEARGRFCTFLHQDDANHPARFAALQKTAERFAGAGLIFHWVQFIDQQGQSLNTMRHPFGRGTHEVSKDAYLRAMLVQNGIALPGVAFDLELARSVGLMDEALPFSADWKFWLKLGCGAVKIVASSEVLASYRVHGSSLTFQIARQSEMWRSQLEAVAREYRQTALELGADVAAAQRLSVDVNCLLGGFSHGNKVELVRRTLRSLAGAGFSGFWRYLKASMLWDRLTARLLAVLRPIYGKVRGAGALFATQKRPI